MPGELIVAGRAAALGHGGPQGCDRVSWRTLLWVPPMNRSDGPRLTAAGAPAK
jgi:hypothetical protein